MKNLFGLKFTEDFNVYNSPLDEVEVEFEPIVRSFSLSSLHPNKLQMNLPKYIDSDKHDLADAAFGIV